jgi:RNA polymerase sigma-70 factor (ECF subfamily)
VSSVLIMPERSEASRLDVAGLVREHQAGLWRFLRALGCDARLAEEIAQDTFVAVLRRPFTARDARATAAYLRTTAKHLLLKAKRSGMHRPRLDLDAIEAAWVEDCGDDGGDAFVAALRACMERLEQRSQELLRGHYTDGDSRARLAARFGLSEDGIKSWLRRVRGALRLCVERRVERDVSEQVRR